MGSEKRVYKHMVSHSVIALNNVIITRRETVAIGNGVVEQVVYVQSTYQQTIIGCPKQKSRKHKYTGGGDYLFLPYTNGIHGQLS